MLSQVWLWYSGVLICYPHNGITLVLGTSIGIISILLATSWFLKPLTDDLHGFQYLGVNIIQESRVAIVCAHLFVSFLAHGEGIDTINHFTVHWNVTAITILIVHVQINVYSSYLTIRMLIDCRQGDDHCFRRDFTLPYKVCVIIELFGGERGLEGVVQPEGGRHL